MSWIITGTEKTPVDPNFANVSLLLHGDGANGSTTIIDSSPSPKTVTAVGNAQISTAQSKFGGSSLAFDGSGDYLSAGDFADHSLSGVPFTVELWVYPTSYATGGPGQEGRTVVGKWNNNGWRIDINTSSIFWYTDFTIRHSTAISLNQWTHIAICGDGATTSMYKDGVKVSGPNSDAFSNSTGKNLIIGALLYGLFEYYFNGYIDDLRITKGVARYTANFTPPTAPFPDI